jgi:hypothetical protein
MNTEGKVILSGFVLILIIAVSCTVLVMGAKQREAVAQAKADAAQQVIEAKQKTIDAAEKSIESRKTDLDEWKREHDKEIAAITTSTQAMTKLNDKGLGLTAVPAPTAANPNAVEYRLPEEKLIPLYQAAAKCDERDRLLQGCKADLADTNTQVGALKEQRDKASGQAKEWEQAAKGGSKTQRFFSGAKKVVVGLAIGAAVGYAAHH